ncbi:DUF1253-domain-containing protein [Metschnikowia bicuspidata]|uniref:U3 small nucleolar RNA-associated protein 25 n=1 Tax=Metschnikowia bicuspidata TaxID=27322 RepID=A0A4V1J376_9ASCO|nr:DUF1253-domain-containing protein [Metschnikowia bicuspidata]
MPKRELSDASRPRSGAKKHRNGHGRQTMRTVTRTSRRDDPTEQAEESDSHLEPEEEQTETPNKINDIKAYNALLTLLESDHPQKPAPKAKKPPSTSQITALETKDSTKEESDDENQAHDLDEPHELADKEEEEGADFVAGLNVEEPSDEESELEFDALDDHANFNELEDAFQAHFNGVSEEYANNKSKLLETGKWETVAKTSISHGSYIATAQVPPGAKSSSVGENTTLKQRVRSSFVSTYSESLNELELELLHNMLQYQDVNFPYKNFKNNFYKKLYILHVLNHVFKTRDRVMKNNEKIKKYNDAMKNGTLKKGAQEPELRDQGFTRPKVLILLPTRNSAYETIEQIIKMSGAEQQENHKKFKSQFFDESAPPQTKPDDFRHIFKGNTNDFFSLGLKFTRKAVKLYSSFYNSDILVASPIGLSMILEDSKQSKSQYDFLSSIEVLVIDHGNQIEMQNWDHMGTVLKYLNKIPKEFHGADFSRIRMWSVNDQARLMRQSLVFSEYLTPKINSIISRSQNIGGKVRYRPVFTAKTCIMNSVGLKIKQIFQRFESPDPRSNPEARFKFFINSVLPSTIKQSSYENGLLVYIPSYFDYVRVKAHMKQHTKINFASIDEYSSKSKILKARYTFNAGKVQLLLYTERLHYYSRFDLYGVKNVLIYEAPSNPLSYKELLRYVGKSVFKEQADLDLSFVKTIYSKWDSLSLERIVGNERAPMLCNSVNELYEFR